MVALGFGIEVEFEWLCWCKVGVGFNNTWKESLGELSGGQRSLVALSLVLAMLLFKPAPLYILDEVDAALDLSHTQNIGLMLRDHFRHSQVRAINTFLLAYTYIQLTLYPRKGSRGISCIPPRHPRFTKISELCGTLQT
jgi:translation initiation factor RLI1